MKKETMAKLLKIVSNAILNEDIKQLEWLANFFNRQFQTNKELDDFLNNKQHENKLCKSRRNRRHKWHC